MRESKEIYTRIRIWTGASRTNGGCSASSSGRFRVGGWEWRGRYKGRVSSCGQVIVIGMFVPFLFEYV